MSLSKWLKNIFSKKKERFNQRIDIDNKLDAALRGLNQFDSGEVYLEWTDPGFNSVQKKKGDGDDDTQ